MIEELSIQNYALIERLSLEFEPGFNVLTGETGAGKSILAGALGLMRGARGDTSVIRTGTEEAMVSAVFSVDHNREATDWLAAHSIEPEDGTVIVRRTIKQSGRGTIYVQSVPVTRADLDEFSALLFDIHGQHEHQSLFSEDNHRRFLDRFGGLESDAAELYTNFSNFSSLKKKLERIQGTERERLREADILQFAVKEIEDARLTSGEEEELVQERSILSQHEKLFTYLDQIYDQTSENRNGALAQVRSARSAMDSVAAIDPGVAQLAKRLEDAFFELEDIAEEIHSYRASVNFSPDRLEAVEDRLMAIHRLEKKYGATIADVLEYCADARQQLDHIENWEQDKETLVKEIREAEQRVLAQASALSAARKRVGKELESQIEAILKSLGMEKTVFRIEIAARTNEKGAPSCGPHGLDSIAFRISPNPGEPLKPLKDIASGGEISRIMLAIKTVLAETDRVETMVFDEVDSGIGGEVAVAVGTYLRELSKNKQVLCITHLASIAVRADNHIKVEKRVRDDRTVTEIEVVRGDTRVKEIARMLSGDKTAAASLSHAEDLLKKHSSA